MNQELQAPTESAENFASLLGSAEELPSSRQWETILERKRAHLIPLARDYPLAWAVLTGIDRGYHSAPHLEILDWWIRRAVVGVERRMVITWPPRHGKSEYGSKAFPSWYLGRFPKNRLMQIGYSDEFAKEFGREARDIFEEWAPLVFGSDVRLLTRNEPGSLWRTNQGGEMRSAGRGGKIIGKGANWITIDDLIKNADEAISQAEREHIWQFLQGTLLRRLEPGAVCVAYNTRWDPDDYIGRLLSTRRPEAPAWRLLRFPAVATSDEHHPDGRLFRRAGDPLFPERFDAEALREIEHSTERYWWETQYQGNPIKHGSFEWDQDCFDDGMWFDNWPDDIWLRVVALDPSKGKDAKKGDYSAFVMLGVDRAKRIYVDATLERRPVGKIAGDFCDAWAQFAPHAAAVETNQFQELLKNEIVKEMASRGYLDAHISEFTHTSSKINRIRGIDRFVRPSGADRRMFYRRTPGGRLLVEQLQNFPNANHDDGPDALEMAIQLAKQTSPFVNEHGKRVA